jgi:hypothetical protein
MSPPITRSSTRNLSSGYQSSSDQAQPDVRLSDFTSTLDEIKTMLTAVNAESEFERTMKTVVSLLIGQMKEWRVDQFNSIWTRPGKELPSVWLKCTTTSRGFSKL